MRSLLICLMVWVTMLPSFSDTIVTEKNKITPVLITRETFDQIYYQFVLNGSLMPEQKIETRKVVRVEYEKIPLEYQTAEKFMEIQSYSKAIEAYQRAAKNKDIMQQHALYKIGLCYQYLKKPVEVIRTYQNLLKEYPETFYKAEVYWELGHAYLNTSKWAEAIKMFDLAKQTYQKKDPIHPRNQESQYYQAFSMEKSGQHKDAIPLYQAILLKIGQNKVLGHKIQLSLVNCYNQTKQPKYAQQTLATLIKEVEPEQKEILANVYQHYGKMHFDSNKMEEALLCYLRIIMMYPEVPEITQEAYHKAIYCMDLLKKDRPEYVARVAQLKQMQQRMKK